MGLETWIFFLSELLYDVGFFQKFPSHFFSIDANHVTSTDASKVVSTTTSVSKTLDAAINGVKSTGSSLLFIALSMLALLLCFWS